MPLKHRAAGADSFSLSSQGKWMDGAEKVLAEAVWSCKSRGYRS